MQTYDQTLETEWYLVVNMKYCLNTASKMCYGLTTKQTSIIAINMHCATKITVSPVLDQNQCAETGALQGFMDWH